MCISTGGFIMKNRKNWFLFLMAVWLFSCASIKQVNSDSNNVIGAINEYGGITKEIINNNLNINNKWIKIVEYYDGSNSLVKTIATLSAIITEETGIIQQIEYYHEGTIVRYEMFFTEEFKEKHDYNRVIEFVGNNKLILRTVWFIDDIVIDVINYPQNMNSYHFYNIKYIENVLSVLYEPNAQGENILLSAKYVNIRSVIKFDKDLIELNETDFNILKYYTSFSFISQDFLNNYRKKVRVYHEGKYYWFFVHSQLERHINGQDATISYIPQLWNGELYLLGIGLYSF